jgi:hypothetical protein
MELELKHLTLYLPGLKILTAKHQFKYGGQEVLLVNGFSIDDDGELNIEMLRNGDLEFSNRMRKPIKPILYPLDLTKPIWFEGKEIVPKDEIIKEFSEINSYECTIEQNLTRKHGVSYVIFDGKEG